MRIDIVTVFPEMIEAALDHSIVKRARERGLITIHVVNLRDFTQDRHHTTDDIPYGGGGGMIMKIEPIARALAHLTSASFDASDTFAEMPPPPSSAPTSANFDVDFDGEAAQTPENEVNYNASAEGRRPRIVLTDPRGTRFTQAIARQWAREEHLIILCGHYEGVDERVRQHLVTDEISVGDYILTGGELPALLIADALTRLQTGALGDAHAPDKDTFADDLLEYPHYTRPREFEGHFVPDILLCGHHAQITRWRRWHQLRATRERRPDLFARLNLSRQDIKLLESEEPTAPPNPKAAARYYPAPGTAQAEQAEPDEPNSADPNAAPEFPPNAQTAAHTAGTQPESHGAAKAADQPEITHAEAETIGAIEHEETDGTGI